MARVEKINKWLDSSEKEAKRPKPKKKGISPSSGVLGKKKLTYSGFVPTNELINKIQMLLKETPDSPQFLGKRKLQIKDKKKRFFRKRRYPDLTSLRVDLNKLSQSGKPDVHNRQKVRADLRAYPEIPDLYVINAIYTYQDIPKEDKNAIVSQMSHNKLNEVKLLQLKKAIEEIAMAFHSGGLNVFNVNWFMKIYIEYLNAFKGRLTYEYAALDGRPDSALATLGKKVKGKQAEIISLLSVTDKLGGIARLSRRLNGTTYLSEGFTPIEIKKAAVAVQQAEPTKSIAEGRTAAKTLFVIITVLFLLARVPILRDLVESILQEIPDEDRGILLRKRMVHTLMLMTEFELAVASMDKDRARKAGDELYGYCLTTIKQYTKGSVLKEQYEVDPYLKAIWMIKSSDGLYTPHKFKEMINQGYGMINTISGDQNMLKEPLRETIVDIGNKYLYQLDSIMDVNGWLGKNESDAWRNRS